MLRRSQLFLGITSTFGESMSLAQGNNTPTRPRIEPGSPNPESDALTTRPVRSPTLALLKQLYFCKEIKFSSEKNFQKISMKKKIFFYKNKISIA